MRREDAPPAGWYPDPEGGSRLRYWEGDDWSDRYRGRPARSLETPMARSSVDATQPLSASAPTSLPTIAPPAGAADSQAIISEVRQAAREEAERAAQLFGDQARSTVRSVGPLITQYTSTVTKWFRRIALIVIVLIIGYFLFQAYAQASLFDWLGDRIDKVTEDGAPTGITSHDIGK